MAKIEFSQGFMSGLSSRILKLTSVPASATDMYALGLFSTAIYGSQGQSSFRIFKGTKPTIAFIKNTTNALSLYNDDLLISYEEHLHDLSTNTVVANPLIIKSIYKKATKSGNATWFYFARTSPAGNHTVTGHAIVGDVGVIGSGADLELPDTNIILDNNYRVDNFKIEFPSFWEY